MMRYDCTVNLGGSVLNQVSKLGVSAAEVIILRTLHGGDAVNRLVPIRNDKTPHAQERDRLDRLYGPALGKLTPAQSVTSLFGPAHTKLPVKIDDVEDEAPEADVEDEAA